MESLIFHLRSLIRVNRQILNLLHKDDISLSDLRAAFDKREVHTGRIQEMVPEIDKDKLSEEDSASLKALIDRFDQQSQKIQKALTYIVQKSQDKLEDAVKRRKAEEGYQGLKRIR